MGGIANMLSDLLGSKVKKASKIMDVGMDVGIGVIDAAKSGIKHAALNALKERANSVARDWMLKEFNLDVGKNGINAASLTRLVNESIKSHGLNLELSNIGDVRAVRNEITKYAVELILEEMQKAAGAEPSDKSPTDFANRIIVLARKKIADEIDNQGGLLDNFQPDKYALRVIENYGKPKEQAPSALPPEEAEKNRERQKKYRAAHKGE